MTEQNPDLFSRLTLSASMLSNLDQLGYSSMTPIQSASLPLALVGKDLIAQASTGSGKTAAFGIVLVEKLLPADFAVQALILCPTRELADQVSQEIRRLARATGNVKVVTLCGGVALRGQVQSLEHGAHVVVGTPGRIMDHLERGSLKLKGLKTLVLDEADRMLDMGFFDDIAKVARQCPTPRQTLLFSATYPDGIAKLAAQFMKEPQTVRVQTQHSAAKIKQIFIEVKESERLHAVSQVLLHFRPESTLAFCNTKQQCRDLVAVLQGQGFSALALYGELEQRERDQVLIQFANRSCSILVATDVAARGLDVAQLEAVVNVDVTPDSQVHIHRVGRTGRADAEGLAVTLASLNEMGNVGKIEVLQGRESVWQPLSSLTPTGKGMLVPAMATLQIVGGRKEKIRAGDVLGALTGEAGFTREQVGKINVNEFSTYVAVQRQVAAQAVEKLSHGRVKGRSVRVRMLEDATGMQSAD
ncbi:MAG: ATP-dependent RNA helicase DbpA [Betaproteobacteria bacterium]|jgi:ATP-independent RNA helicase DbpA|nr:ATP-dependent RNA helicase DbpA [Betaproteobacteria bacterium]NBX89859.1 ATP-dependent RNA helicase DbpA [Betaproteobacteria bacterium]